jgi:hypothetical protein
VRAWWAGGCWWSKPPTGNWELGTPLGKPPLWNLSTFSSISTSSTAAVVKI